MGFLTDMAAWKQIEHEVRKEEAIARYRRGHDIGTRWRTGRKVGRTIYAVLGDQPDDGDPLIGVMDTPELAAEAVRQHNLDIDIRCSR